MAARAEGVSEPARPTTQLAVPESGFWPTERMIDFFLARGIGAMAERYKLDEQQQEALREQLESRVPAFLGRNRARLQPFVNYMMEAQVIGEELDPKVIAGLAKPLGPVVDDFRRTLKQTDEAFRRHLRPGQLRTWQRDVVGFYAALAAAETQVGRWERGLARPDEWPLNAMVSRGKGTAAADGEVAATQRGAAKGTPSGFRDIFSLAKPKGGASRMVHSSGREVPLDRWESYVDRFIRTHKLSESQAHQAKAILRDVKGRAEQQRRQNEDVYSRIRGEMKSADADRKADLREQLADLEAPLQDLFDELTDRLDNILTSDQR